MKRAVVAAVAAITIVGVAPAISLHAAPAPSEVRATGRISKPPITFPVSLVRFIVVTRPRLVQARRGRA